MTYHPVLGKPAMNDDFQDPFSSHKDVRIMQLEDELAELKQRLMRCERALYNHDDSDEYFAEEDPEHLHPESSRGIYGEQLEDLAKQWGVVYNESVPLIARNEIEDAIKHQAWIDAHPEEVERRRKLDEEWRQRILHTTWEAPKLSWTLIGDGVAQSAQPAANDASVGQGSNPASDCEPSGTQREPSE